MCGICSLRSCFTRTIFCETCTINVALGYVYRENLNFQSFMHVSIFIFYLLNGTKPHFLKSFMIIPKQTRCIWVTYQLHIVIEKFRYKHRCISITFFSSSINTQGRNKKWSNYIMFNIIQNIIMKLYFVANRNHLAVGWAINKLFDV